MNRTFIAWGIFFLIILSFGFYFFVNRNKPDDLVTQKSKLETSLTIAKEKLNKERQKLANMTNDFRNAFAFGISVQDQMRQVSEIVGKTDFMFTDASGEDPQFLVKNFLNSLLLNNERKNINLIIADWQKKMDILSVDKIDLVEGEKVKKEMQTIKTFIEDLTMALDSFTTKNSGFSQMQIDSYFYELPSVDVINKVLASLQEAIDSSSNKPSNYDVYDVSAPSLIPADIIAQQIAANNAQDQVIKTEEQIKKIEEQISPVSDPVIPSEDISEDSNPQDQIPNSNNTDNNNTFYIPENSKQDKIIIQPGPPKLIQGTNQY